MTRFFEVTGRDGTARIGRMLIRGDIETPYVFSPARKDNIITNAGNAWVNKPVEECSDSFTVQPYIGMPYHVRKELVNLYTSPHVLQTDNPKAVPVHPEQEIPVADMYIMSGARSIEGDSRALLNSFIKIREKARYDTALYVPGLATPENVSLLIYLGADVVDDVLVTAKAYQSLYLTQDGEYRLNDLAALPCSCEICAARTVEDLKSLIPEERSKALARHNYLKLKEEVDRVKVHIKNGVLREYMEKQCRSRPWLTALLRLADAEYGYLEKRTPTYRSSQLLACSAESQNRVEVRRFAERVKTRFKSDGEILLIIPCSARKPYSTSQSHMAISSAIGKLRNNIREVILTSPMGVVPRELELVYPAAHYDVAVTGVWDLEERQWVADCLRDFIDNNDFKRIIAHVEGAYVDVCRQADREMTFTSTGKVTGEDSLKNLVDCIKQAIDEVSPKPRNYPSSQLDIFRKMADYEFGAGKGDLLVGEKCSIKGKYPKYVLFDGRDQLCSMIPEYGSLALTLEGARRMGLENDYFVEIEDFIPKGSILAPGVKDADMKIRPGDDVYVRGKKAVAVGKAKMSGPEMVSSSRGIAVELRHVEKLK
ncbi:tRNA-ribosyltransferase [Methanocella sp. CWC-04]|uniref:tRNA-ribosyltransferase n=1 Tax=Methanooceanicella nereidis TaxID=2052831 RepID=A0AAP2RF01_9EURY|nr:archaeosine synthase subunit alpha [Methanocella sp. CWC-04]MCD1295626.1 tRNA-ribosyltransferase [Methanocella sp. CWC-04]